MRAFINTWYDKDVARQKSFHERESTSCWTSREIELSSRTHRIWISKGSISTVYLCLTITCGMQLRHQQVPRSSNWSLANGAKIPPVIVTATVMLAYLGTVFLISVLVIFSSCHKLMVAETQLACNNFLPSVKLLEHSLLFVAFLCISLHWSPISYCAGGLVEVIAAEAKPPAPPVPSVILDTDTDSDTGYWY